MENFRFIIKKLSIADSIELVLSTIKDNEVIHFRKRLYDLETNRRLNIIHLSEYQVEKNKLEYDWLQKIDLIRDEEIYKIARLLQLDASIQEFQDKLYLTE